MKISKFFWPILGFLAASTAFLIPASFVSGSSLIYPALQKTLKIRVDPGYSGGPVLASFLDPAGDDRGGGSLTYPLHEKFVEPNAVDLVAYEVYRPMVNAPWTSPRDYWQLSISFAKLGNPFGLPAGYSGIVASVYVDTDGDLGGSTSTASERAELVSFPAEFPWDFMVKVSSDYPNQAELLTFKGERRMVQCIVVRESATVYLRIPLDLNETRRILDGRQTRHWVLAGFADPLGAGGYMAVRESAGLRSGGGSSSINTAKAYDIIVPAGYEQAEILSTPHGDEQGIAVLPPLATPRWDILSDYRDDKPTRAAAAETGLMESLLSLAERERKLAEIRQADSLKEALESADERQLAIALFSAGRTEESLPLFEKILTTFPGDPSALAYKGSILAMRGSAAGNPAQAVAIVMEAYGWLDRGVQSAEAAFSAVGEAAWSEKTLVENYVTALMNRANVSASVPDSVFGKASIAVRDFEAAAIVFGKSGNKAAEADAFLQAALCQEKRGNEKEARVLFLKALAVAERSASVSLALAKRGYLK